MVSCSALCCATNHQYISAQRLSTGCETCIISHHQQWPKRMQAVMGQDDGQHLLLDCLLDWHCQQPQSQCQTPGGLMDQGCWGSQSQRTGLAWVLLGRATWGGLKGGVGHRGCDSAPVSCESALLEFQTLSMRLWQTTTC